MADGGSLSISPVRSLDDFLLESARFQIPNWKDGDKWGNRVVQNLLYYQTNYFMIYVMMMAGVGVLHPTKMFYGMVAVVGICSLAYYLLASKRRRHSTLHEAHPIIVVAVVVVVVYGVLCVMGCVVVFLMGVLLPVCVILVHASMRLRNIKNKIVNKVNSVTLKTTPMDVILEALGIEHDALMSEVSLNSTSAKLLNDLMQRVPHKIN